MNSERTTSVNPGSLTPYVLKTWREVASSLLEKIKHRQYLMAARYVVSEAANHIMKAMITKETGKYYCPICERHTSSFVHLSNAMRFSWNSVCYKCSSRPRHRGLFFLYKELVAELGAESNIIHFAPEPVFYTLFRSGHAHYLTSDFYLKDVDLPGEDIQGLSLQDNAYDIVLCNHVIEHVLNDKRALEEIYRILRPGGRLFLTIPGDFSRHETIYFSHLDNNGHYRDYGLDVLDHLKSIFDKTDLIDLGQRFSNYSMGIPPNEMVFVGYKLQ